MEILLDFVERGVTTADQVIEIVQGRRFVLD
jgi:hypothetical protein